MSRVLGVSTPIVVDHDPQWQQGAAALTGEIAALLGPAALRVEHIGSTSIPGMAAKPIYDLQLSVADLNTAAAAFDGPLTTLGFTRMPYQHDHVPAGSDDPQSLWVKRYWNRRTPGLPPVNLHCRLAGSPNERLALLFRDWFRAHPRAVPAYARFKQSLAAEIPDVDVYTDLKDPVVDLVVTVAEEWAAVTGWKP
ncbi:hypothetical protein Acsp01_73830 [Actinoplanes sp. NBRC 101535]|nr:hypothetical protein Acsp01_73830 [Actinoplanes sp. NBRC 101535]